MDTSFQVKHDPAGSKFDPGGSKFIRGMMCVLPQVSLNIVSFPNHGMQPPLRRGTTATQTKGGQCDVFTFATNLI
jgi:hypothetical protein